MSNQAEESAVNSAAAGTVVSRFWVSTQPFFDAELLVVPAHDQEDGTTAGIELLDPDGSLINQVQVSFPAGIVGLVELDPLFGSCKFEGGIKHGQLRVSSAPGTAHYCRIHTKERAALLGHPVLVTEEQPAFFPLQIAEDLASIVALVNYGDEATDLRCRMYFGSRSPEMELSIPGQGARLISVEEEFLDRAALPEGKQLQAYLRLTTRAGSRIGAVLLEQVHMLNDSDFFVAVC